MTQHSDAPTRHDSPPRWRKIATLLTVCLAVLMINIDTTIVNVALPSLSREINADTNDLLWIVDGYNLAFAALVLMMGSLTDKFGRRPGLAVGLLGFGVMSAVGALVGSPQALIAARVGMGVFAAVIFPTTLSIISNTFQDRKERAAALGVWGAVVGMGVATGPLLGGYLLEHFYWGSIFWAMVPFAALGVVLTVAFVPESRDPSVPRLDPVGLVLSVLTLGVLTYTIIEAHDRGWSSTPTIAGFVLAAALAAAFVTWERRVEHPMLDVSLFADRRFSAAAGSVMVCFFALFGFIFVIAQYFQFVRGYSPLSTGARLLPVATSIAIASVLGANLAQRLGTRVIVATGLLSLATAFLWISVIDVNASYPGVVVPQMLFLGAGLGLVQTPATESILRVLPPSRAGVGSAVNDAVREIGGTLGVAVIGSVFSTVYASSLADSAFRSLPDTLQSQAQDSVGVGSAAAAKTPALLRPFQNSFMDGLSTATLTIGLICVAGALAAAVSLPGREIFKAGSADEDNQDHGTARASVERRSAGAAPTAVPALSFDRRRTRGRPRPRPSAEAPSPSPSPSLTDRA